MTVKIVKGLQREFVRPPEISNKSKSRLATTETSDACSVSFRHGTFKRIELRDYNEAKEHAEDVADSVRLQENSLAAHENVRNAVLI